jgi:hypothetical protein
MCFFVWYLEVSVSEAKEFLSDRKINVWIPWLWGMMTDSVWVSQSLKEWKMESYPPDWIMKWFPWSEEEWFDLVLKELKEKLKPEEQMTMITMSSFPPCCLIKNPVKEFPSHLWLTSSCLNPVSVTWSAGWWIVALIFSSRWKVQCQDDFSYWMQQLVSSKCSCRLFPFWRKNLLLLMGNVPSLWWHTF